MSSEEKVQQIPLNSEKETMAFQKYVKGQFIDGANFIDSLLFSWLYPLLGRSKHQQVLIENLPSLPNSMVIKGVQKSLAIHLKKSNRSANGERSQLVKIIYQAFKSEIHLILLLVLVVSILKMYSPFLCAQIMQYIKQRNQRPLKDGILLFLGILSLSLLRSICEAQMNYRLGILGLNLSSTLSMQIYRHSLSHPLLRERMYEPSQIINYSQVDCQRMASLGNQLSSLIATPIQIIIGIVLMYVFIGISFLAGAVMMALMIGLTYLVSRVTIRYNKEVLKAKDKRMSITQQLLESIRFIKVNRLEEVYLDKVINAREEEIRMYKKKGIFQVLGFFVYWLASPMILAATFITYIVLGNEMKSQVAFTTIIIFAILQYPIRQLPTSFSEVLQTLTSLQRIDKYLKSKTISKKNGRFHSQLGRNDYSIRIENGNFLWKKKQMNQQKEKPMKYCKFLKDISLTIMKNSFTMIVGKIGSGKSNLLLAILNQMKSSKQTSVLIDGSIAFCSEKPWIMSKTVKQNIIGNLPYQQQRFKRAVFYSALERDLEILPKKEQTEIGEKGVNISGGQKARISLARAIYSDKDIYLLDDILGAVDQPTADFLIKETFLDYLKNKTILMVTHSLHYLKFSDRVILMKKGKIAHHCPCADIFNKDDYGDLCRSQQSNKKLVSNDENISKELKLVTSALITKSEMQREPKQKQTYQKIVEELMIPEEVQQGKIKPQVFQQYINYNGGYIRFALVVVLAMVLWICCTTIAAIVMQEWCDNPIDFSSGLYLYVGFSLLSSFFILIRAYILIISSTRQGEIVHKQMIKSLLGASQTYFFNRIPTGRILNRLTKDLRELDEAIGPAIGGLLVCSFQLLGTIVICLYSSTIYLLIPTVLMLYACSKVKDYYLETQRQVSRLQKVVNSPIVNGFVSALRSLQSLRAYNLEDESLNQQMKLIDDYRRARIVRQGLESWFALHLSYLSLIVNMTAIAYCIFSGEGTPALVGLLITYALNLNSDINLSILCYAYFETKVISLERIYSLMKIEPENEEWGCQNIEDAFEQISFNNACIRYRKDQQPILKNVNLTIKAGENIGIIGRTGSGKTSLFNALLGIAEISEGSILVNRRQLKDYSLARWRQKITVIDQESTIMKGSFRYNLDVFRQYSDAELEKVIEDCGLSQIVKIRGGLDEQIEKEDLSVGERQLICLCRALLRNSQIILIDQGTASLDPKSDELIQKALRTNFKGRTILTIAHRIHTLQKCSRILIFGDGRITKEGTPEQLLFKNGLLEEMHNSQ